jgi:hypoxanthine phosphoribosyltransferase
VEYLKLKGATRVRVVCLLEKDIPGEPRVIQPDIVGFSVPSSAFVVGWGLDHKGFFRNMPFIGVTVE